MAAKSRREIVLAKILIKLTDRLIPNLSSVVRRALDDKPVVQVVMEADELSVSVAGMKEADYEVLNLTYLARDVPMEQVYQYALDKGVDLPIYNPALVEMGTLSKRDWIDLYQQIQKKLPEMRWPEDNGYSFSGEHTNEVGMSVPGIVRDLLVLAHPEISFQEAQDFAVLVNSRLMDVDWLHLANGKQFECIFDPALDAGQGNPQKEVKTIDYCMVVTKFYPREGSMENYMVVTRTRDGKKAAGVIKGDNATAIMFHLCGGWEHFTYAEREVGSREYRQYSKNMKYLGCEYNSVIADLLKQFDEDEL